MRRFLLAGASLLALLAGSPAEATTLMFGYTGTIVPYVVPETGTYQIIAWGAEGGGSPGAAVGGLGAEIGGETELLANTRLEILVGQMGASGKEKYAGGGGFGMFIHRGSGGSSGGGGTGGGYYRAGGGGANGQGGGIGGYGGGAGIRIRISAAASAIRGAARVDLAGEGEAVLAAWFLLIFSTTISMAAVVTAAIAGAAAVRVHTKANTAAAAAPFIRDCTA